MMTRGLATALLASIALLAACERNEPNGTAPETPKSSETRDGAPAEPKTTDLATPSNPTQDRSETRHNPPGPRPDPGPAPGPAATATETMTQYLADVQEATRLLRGVKDSATAGSAAARLGELADRINATSSKLSALPDDQKSRVRDQYKDQIATTTADFRAEADRIEGDSSYSASIREPVERIKLFE